MPCNLRLCPSALQIPNIKCVSFTEPRTGSKRGRAEEEADSRPSLVGSGLGSGAGNANSTKRQARSRLGVGDRRTWRAGLTPAPVPRLPAPPAPAAEKGAGACVAQMSSLAARRILISLETVDRVRRETLEPRLVTKWYFCFSVYTLRVLKGGCSEWCCKVGGPGPGDVSMCRLAFTLALESKLQVLK